MKKVVIITGAGFTAGPEFSKITTASLTTDLRGLNSTKGKINGLTPGEYLYRKLSYHYTGGYKNTSLSDVNFETMVHLLEEMYAYYTSLHPYKDSTQMSRDKMKSTSRNKGVKPAFSYTKPRIQQDLNKALHNGRGLKYKFIRRLFNEFIDHISLQLVDFNKDAKQIGMRAFVDDFMLQYFPDNEYVKRIYTVNYDSWIADHCGYYDGFNEYGNFDSSIVLNEFSKNCHYNLHGSILWHPTKELSGVSKSKKPIRLVNNAISSDFPINREPLLPTPIITGYNKSARMKYAPYQQLFHSFLRDVISADLILLIGYGFSDNHINNILKLAKKNVVIVTHLIDSELKDEGKLIIDPSHPDVKQFVSAAREAFGVHFEEGSLMNGKAWFQSEEGRVKVWWKGIGNDFYANWNDMKNG